MHAATGQGTRAQGGARKSLLHKSMCTPTLHAKAAALAVGDCAACAWGTACISALW